MKILKTNTAILVVILRSKIITIVAGFKTKTDFSQDYSIFSRL